MVGDLRPSPYDYVQPVAYSDRAVVLYQLGTAARLWSCSDRPPAGTPAEASGLKKLPPPHQGRSPRSSELLPTILHHASCAVESRVRLRPKMSDHEFGGKFSLCPCHSSSFAMQLSFPASTEPHAPVSWCACVTGASAMASPHGRVLQSKSTATLPSLVPATDRESGNDDLSLPKGTLAVFVVLTP